MKTLFVIEEKSYGDFKSLDESVFIQGTLEIEFDKGRQYAAFKQFKVTKNAKLRPALSTNIAGRSVIFLADKLLGTIGDQRYEIPKNVDLNEHRYFILWDKSSNIPISYAELK
ncbi:MAG: hypothetical protein HRU03_04365 [Nanoarchaeales archaeon]|nr:hypothetical protein [Nanoarchaeales archaeon]